MEVKVDISVENQVANTVENTVENKVEKTVKNEVENKDENKDEINFYNKNLWSAFTNNNEKRFVRWLELGANPEQIFDNPKQAEDKTEQKGDNLEQIDDNKPKLSIFEQLCTNNSANNYVQMCLDFRTDPNRANPYNGYYPIHHAVQNLAIENVKALLKADGDCANQTINFNKTPLHLLSEIVDDNNLRTVFAIIKIFSEFGGNFSWPARQSGNETPFQILLANLTRLRDRPTCLQIIKYLIGRYPKIDIFQKEECAKLIRQNFEEIFDEYQDIANWEVMIDDDTMDWKSELKRLIVENEPEFLVKFDIQKTSNAEELKVFLSDGELVTSSIEYDKFESFVEIFGMFNFNVETVASKVVSCSRPRILKYLLNHESVETSNPIWMITILLQMVDEEIDIEPNILKCFHILLNHPKYSVNEPIPDYGDLTALHYAGKSEYAVMELLKKGARLDIRCKSGIKPIQTISKVALKKFLDSCITTCEAESINTNDYYMVIDYSFLKASEMQPIEYMAKSKDLQPLIEHPVIASFLFLKWLESSSLLYLNFLLFSSTAICFSTYLILVYVPPNYQDFSNYGWFQILFLILAYLSLMIFYSKEFFQFFTSPVNYAKKVENYFEIGLMYLMAVALTWPIEDQYTRRTITAVLLLAFAIEWTLMLGALPMFSGSNYIVMLKKVAVNFLRTLSFYSLILLAFVLSFYTLLNQTKESTGNSTMRASNETEKSNNSSSTNQFENHNMFSVLFHVILMLTGDFDTLSEGGERIIIGRIFLLLFVLSMTIVMMNLLLGITVSDTAAIQKEAELYKWLERVNVLGEHLNASIKWLDPENKQSVDDADGLLNYFPKNKVKVEISSLESNGWIYIPKPHKYHNRENADQGDIEGDPFPLMYVKQQAMQWSLCSSRVPDKMDSHIIQSGLKVLESNQELKAQSESEKKERIRRHNTIQTLARLELQQQQQGLKFDKIDQKLNQMFK